MKDVVVLETARGSRFEIRLENWGSGLDILRRRWVLVDRAWVCVDSGEAAQEVAVAWTRIFGGHKSSVQIYGLLPV